MKIEVTSLREFYLNNNILTEKEFQSFFIYKGIFKKAFKIKSKKGYKNIRSDIKNRFFIENEGIVSYDLSCLNESILKNKKIFLVSKKEYIDIIAKRYKQWIEEWCQNRRTEGVKDFFQNQDTVKRKFLLIFLFIFIVSLFAFRFFCFFIFSLYSLTVIFKIFLFCISFNDIFKKKLNNIDTKSLKKCTILVPLFKEKAVLFQIIKKISLINYSKHLVDVRLVIEEDDDTTKFELSKIKLPANFEIISVPFFLPRTKPKALSYAALFCDSEFISVYDAEDCPDKDQILCASSLLNENDVVQCSLLYYAKNKRILTSLFDIEYSFWFCFLLPGLSKLKIIFPLGGTSNHFNFSFLEKVGFWDSYNVTEDLEISTSSIFMAVDQVHFNSVTEEGCVSSVSSWLKQRTRWMKGYIMTYLAYFNKINTKLTLKSFVSFHVLIGGSILTFMFLPMLFFVSFVLKLIGGGIFVNSVLIFYTVLCLGFYCVNVVFYLILNYVRKVTLNCRSFVALIVYPFYFFLHFIAVYLAIFDIIKKPFYWAKTDHNIINNC